jgi:D-alanine-D-alanine ligase
MVLHLGTARGATGDFLDDLFQLASGQARAAASSCRLTVLHLAGSPVDPFFADLSRLYAAGCLDALADPDRLDHRVAWVEPGGCWRFPSDLTPASVAAAEPVPLEEALATIRRMAPDVALPQLFCLPGMTTYRALLDLLEIPFVGNTAGTMAVGAHKERAKALVAAAGVTVPEGRTVGVGEPVDLPLPLVVKPVDGDNSSGVALVRDGDDLAGAVAAAAVEASSGQVLVERYVELGREVRCAVLETADGLRALPLEEYAVDTASKPIRDRADKLSGTGDELGLVAKDGEHAWIVASDDPVVPAVQDAARRAFVALGCRDYGLFDFRVDPDGVPHFLEAGLYCSFAPSSVVVMMAEADGIALRDLFATSVARAVARPRRGTAHDADGGTAPVSPPAAG